MGGKVSEGVDDAVTRGAPRPGAHPGNTLLIAGLAGAAVAYASAFLRPGAPTWAGALLAGSAVVTMTGAALLAVRAGRSMVVLGSGGLLLALGAVLLWTIPTVDPAEPRLLLGLPPAVSYLLYGLGLVPALIVPFVYAWSFERATLSEEELDRVRSAATATRRSEPGSDATGRAD